MTEKCIASTLAVEAVSCEEFTVKDKTVKLERLLNNKRESLRWATFVKCAKVTFNTTLARQLPSHYLGLCCILNYWWHSPLIHINQWELNALLAQAVSQYATDVTSLRRVLVSVVNTRAINLALQLARGAEALLQIAAVTCLSPEPFLLHNYFDGKLFSFYYYLSDKGASIEKLCDDLPDRIEMFKFLLMVVQSKNLSIDEEEEEIESDQEDEKKEVANVSIVPEYEAISDDEDDKLVQVEPVTDDDDDELFNDAITGASEETTVETVEGEPSTGVESKDEQETPVQGEPPIEQDTPKKASAENTDSNRSRLDRKDSTNGTVAEMMKLQMTSPDSVTRPRFPSFPSESDNATTPKTPETAPSKPPNNAQPAKQLFPINGNKTLNTPSQPGKRPN